MWIMNNRALLVLVLALVGAWLGTAPAASDTMVMDGYKLVAASAVRARATPATQAPETGRLKLGATVKASARTRDQQTVGKQRGYWYQVDGDGVKGWVFGELLRDFDPAQQDVIWGKLARERVANEHLGFGEYADVYGFIGAVLPKVKDTPLGVEMEFNRLVALQRSLGKIPYDKAQTPPYKQWLESHKGRVFYNEVGGDWVIPADAYWKVVDKLKPSPLGDDLAWQASKAELGGECEGDIHCSIERAKITDGEYLKRYPNGRHAKDALKQTAEVLAFAQQELLTQPDYFRDDNDMGKLLKGWLAIAGNSKADGSAVVQERLKAVFDRYQKGRVI